MPMIVDLDAPEVTPPDQVVSPDGWFTALIDEQWAGVTLSYDGATPPSARNLALNPSVEVDLANTAVYGSATRARITTDAQVGTACVQHTQTAGTFCGSQWTTAAQAAGTVMRASVWVKVPGTGTTCFFAFRNSTTTLGTVSVGTPAANTWVRVTAQFTVPVGQTCDRVAIAYNAGVGVVWLADAMMIETGVSVASLYVDGSQPGCAWEGTANASTSIRVTAVANAAGIRRLLITRQDPGASVPVPVRGANLAWAIEGAGEGYDHEAPLGVGVTYTARPQYADGTWGPESSLGIEVPAPSPVADVWVKSLDTPGASARVTVTAWPQLAWAARIDQALIAGSPYPVAAQDVYSAATSDITLDAEGTAIETVRALLTTPGVLLVQTRPEYHRPDMYILVTDPAEALDAGPDASRTFTAGVLQVERPDTLDQRMRIPGWSYDALAAQFATYDAAAASYPTYQSLALHGVL